MSTDLFKTLTDLSQAHSLVGAGILGGSFCLIFTSLFARNFDRFFLVSDEVLHLFQKAGSLDITSENVFKDGKFVTFDFLLNLK